MLFLVPHKDTTKSLRSPPQKGTKSYT